MSEEKIRIYITVPVEFKDKLKKMADADKRTISNYVINIVEQDEKNKGTGEPK